MESRNCNGSFPPLTVSDVEAVAALLKRFLGLEEMRRCRQQKEEAEDGEEEDSFDYSSDSDVDDNVLNDND